MRITNSAGNDNRGIRRFLRENGITPNVANVERIGREVRRSQTQNETVERVHRERERTQGIPSTVDMKGRDVKARARKIVERQIDSRPTPKR